MKKHTVLLHIVTIIFAGMVYSTLYAQNTAKPTHPPLLSDIEKIHFTHPAQLPLLDCRLDDLELQYYKYLEIEGNTPTMSSLFQILSTKRKWLDEQRSSMDSLYFTLAKVFWDSNLNKHEEALVLVNKALLYNRFYTPSVLLKIEILQTTPNAEVALWTYLESTLSEQYSKLKIRLLCQNIYDTFLSYLQTLNENGLYGDVLQKHESFKNSLTSASRFLIINENTENKVLREAHQGLFASYHKVSEKALRETHVSLSEKYALLAYTYYTKNQAYMQVENPSLQILSKIIDRYKRSALHADADEKAYFANRIANIQNLTGVGIPPKTNETYSESATREFEEDISSLLVNTVDVNTKNVPTQIIDMLSPKEETKKLSTELNPQILKDDALPLLLVENTIKTDTQKIVPIVQCVKKENVQNTLPPTKVSQKKHDAAKQALFDTLYHNAMIALSIRKYADALQNLKNAAELQEQYVIRTKVDMKNLLQNTAIASMEQLLNKAQYRLWINQTDAADSLYQHAENIQKDYQVQTIAEMNQLLASYQEQKQNIFCQKQKSEVQYLTSQAKSYANTQQYGSAYDKINEALLLAQQESCNILVSDLKCLQKEYKRVYTYFELKERANIYLRNKDSANFVKMYLDASLYFEKENLDRLGIKNTVLFNKLTYEQNYALLFFWAKLLYEDYGIKKSVPVQFSEILAYLDMRKYTTPEYKAFCKRMRKNKIL